MFQCSNTVQLTFVGWRNPVERDRFHDSPEYFENLWAGDGIADKPPHPQGLVNLFERRERDHVRLIALIDPEKLSADRLVQVLCEVGLNVKLHSAG